MAVSLFFNRIPKRDIDITPPAHPIAPVKEESTHVTTLKIKHVPKQTPSLPEEQKIVKAQPIQKVDDIKRKVEQARAELTSFQLERAKELYADIIAQYDQLNDNNKGAVYGIIRDLYDERKHAEQLTLKTEA